MVSRMVSRILVIAMLGLMASAYCAAQGTMECVEEVSVPFVTPAMVTSLPATVAVKVLIGKGGVAEKIDYGNIKPIFAHELDVYFKTGSRYISDCEGKTVEFSVQYLVEGEPTVRPVSEVRFRPPNEFVVRSHPVRPALDTYSGQQSPKGMAATFCTFLVRFVDEEHNSIRDVSVTTQPALPITPDESGRLKAFVLKGQKLSISGTAPNYEQVHVNFACEQGESREQFVVMKKKPALSKK